MPSMERDERGASHVELALLAVIVVIIGLVGWYVYHAKQNADQTLNTASNTNSGAAPKFAKNTKTYKSSDTSNSSLQSDLQSITSAATQGNNDMSVANNSLSDQSTFTSVPQ